MPSLLLLLTLCWSLPACAAMEQHFIYFPETRLYATPAAAGLEFENIWFASGDERIHGWLVPGDPEKPLVLFCHGNAGNISHRIENIDLFNRLGLSVFIFDYRGYGKSSGKSSEEGTYQDALGALGFLESRGYKPEAMIYFGRSVGAAVALQLALEVPPGALVLESPFTSIRAMGWHHNPLLWIMAGWALGPRYDNLDKIERVKVPLLIFQGSADTIVPPKMSKELFERANEPKTFHLIRGANHNDTYDVGGSDYWDAWKDFLNQVFASPRPED